MVTYNLFGESVLLHHTLYPSVHQLGAELEAQAFYGLLPPLSRLQKFLIKKAEKSLARWEGEESHRSSHQSSESRDQELPCPVRF